MGEESQIDKLWKEYTEVFRRCDDLSLGRWLSQTLSQLEGGVWRASHPLVATFRLAATVGQDRQIWTKRLASVQSYPESECCRSPLLPLFTRDVVTTGLLCQHCGETAIQFADIPEPLRAQIKKWSDNYGSVHAVAHWDEAEQHAVADYEEECENAAQRAEKLLLQARSRILPRMLEFYPAIIWEDQDECLEVGPEDILEKD